MSGSLNSIMELGGIIVSEQDVPTDMPSLVDGLADTQHNTHHHNHINTIDSIHHNSNNNNNNDLYNDDNEPNELPVLSPNKQIYGIDEAHILNISIDTELSHRYLQQCQAMYLCNSVEAGKYLRYITEQQIRMNQIDIDIMSNKSIPHDNTIFIQYWLQYMFHKSHYLSMGNQSVTDWCLNIICASHNPDTYLRSIKKQSSGLKKCSKQWQPGDFAYSCLSCRMDPQCAICITCFNASDHTNHQYQMIVTGGGWCDCGDTDAWDINGCCDTHKPNHQQYNDPLQRLVQPLLHRIQQYKIKHNDNELIDLTQLSDDTEEIDIEIRSAAFAYTVRLLLPAVVQYVCDTICVLGEYPTHQRRFASVIKVMSWVRKLCRTTPALTRALVLALIAAYTPDMNRLPITMHQQSNSHQNKLYYSSCIDYLVEACISPGPLLVPSRMDRTLCDVCNILINDTEFRCAILQSYIKHYRNLYSIQSKLNTSIPVQIFSSVSLVDSMCDYKADRVLFTLLRDILLRSVQHGTVSELDELKEHRTWDREHKTGECDNAGVVSGKPTLDCSHPVVARQQHHSIVTDIIYICRHSKLAHRALAGKSYDVLLDCISYTQRMSPIKRRLEGHVEYDSDTWQLSWETEFDIYGIIDLFTHPLVQYGLQSNDTIKTGNRFVKSVLRRTVLQLVDDTNSLLSVADNDISANWISLHLPLQRIFARFVSLLLFNNTTTTMNKSLTIHDIILHSHRGLITTASFFSTTVEPVLRIQVLLSQIRAKLWIRNGESIQGQATCYRNSAFSRYAVYSDLFYLQLTAAYVDTDIFVTSCIRLFTLDKILIYNIDDQHTIKSNSLPVSQSFSDRLFARHASMAPFAQSTNLLPHTGNTPSTVQYIYAEDMLRMLIAICNESMYILPGEQAIRRELIHQIIGSSNDCPSHSELIASLPEYLTDDIQSIDHVLNIISTFVPPSGLSPGWYRLNDTCWNEYDPFFYRYTPQQITNADDRYKLFMNNNKTKSLYTYNTYKCTIATCMLCINRSTSMCDIMQLIHSKTLYATINAVLQLALSDANIVNDAMNQSKPLHFEKLLQMSFQLVLMILQHYPIQNQHNTGKLHLYCTHSNASNCICVKLLSSAIEQIKQISKHSAFENVNIQSFTQKVLSYIDQHVQLNDTASITVPILPHSTGTDTSIDNGMKRRAEVKLRAKQRQEQIMKQFAQERSDFLDKHTLSSMISKPPLSPQISSNMLHSVKSAPTLLLNRTNSNSSNKSDNIHNSNVDANHLSNNNKSTPAQSQPSDQLLQLSESAECCLCREGCRGDDLVKQMGMIAYTSPSGVSNIVHKNKTNELIDIVDNRINNNNSRHIDTIHNQSIVNQQSSLRQVQSDSAINETMRLVETNDDSSINLHSQVSDTPLGGTNVLIIFNT